MRIAILANGTRGDIQPLLAIGDELRTRGHSVVMTVNSNMVAWARRSGLEIVDFAVDWESMLKSEQWQKLLAGGSVVALSKVYSEVEHKCSRATAAAMTEACEGADVIVSTLLTGYDALHFSEKYRRPVGSFFMIPHYPTALWCHPLFPIRALGLGVLNRASHRFLYWLRWRHTIGATRALREQLGLPAVTRRPLFEDFLAAAILSSEHLTPRPSEWPERVVLAGFPTLSPALRERLGESTPPDGLAAWLDAGEPAVFFGFGSMPILDPAATLAMVADVAAQRGVRGLIGAGWTDYAVGGKLPEHLFIAPAFDHDAVLPRCRAAVHHGGAGTTGTVLRAGLASVVASVFGDQPFWGWRVQEEGAGVTMPFKKLSRKRLDQALRVVLDPQRRARAQDLGARLRAEDGTRRAADQVERWATLAPVPRLT